MSEGIYVYLWGGLGNQLFQYAAGLAVTAAMRSRPPSRLYLLPAQENGHSARDYRRGLMPLGEPASAGASTDATFWPQDGFAPWNPTSLGMELDAHIKRLLVRGYFQYLPAIAPQVAQIRADLLVRFAEVRRGLAGKYRVQATQSVGSLHLRRGDYTKLQKEGFHLLGPEYYRPALEAVAARGVKPARWLVFSDDPAWCRDQAWLPAGAEVVEEADEVASLILLSLCGAAAVTSNSTFSWWGAVLAAPVVVTYPARWIGGAKPNLFPAGWMRI
jgi:hypothetical protein